ncbi:S24 family peptidase [Erythrobacter rubeus]|uniref:HTH cro/C1-type domain-containing protein n=1 Tax=Erythrobacter rubeus TaxID=2760803 RepID=A0ABR8KWT8_9SPHN|nr:S24 family peptidase [Erythrobacter rubeus]MBD2842682.1 hypothetical protein [Erythrobacter rubeus]
MAETTEIPGEHRMIDRVERKRKELGISARELSMRVTGKPDLIRDMKRRGHDPSVENTRGLAEELGVSIDWLTGSARSPEQVVSEVGIREVPQAWRGPERPEEPGIPLVGTGDCAEIQLCDEQGNLVDIERSSFDPDHTVRLIRRPPALTGNAQLYAIYFQGESMMPRFEPGEVGIVDPTRPPRPGDYVLVQLNNGEDNDVATVLVKRLVSQNARETVLHQFNPDRTFIVPRERISRIHRVLQQTELLFG